MWTGFATPAVLAALDGHPHRRHATRSGRMPPRRRDRARPLRQRAAAQKLVDGVVGGLESVAGGAQVEPPDAHALRAGETLGLLQALLEPGRPVAEGLGVVRVEVLDVEGLEPGALE